MQSSGAGLHRARTRRQSGAVAMLGALWLMIAVICLATIDIGNVFWQKRELQKIADLAALAGAAGDLDQQSCELQSKQNAILNGYEGAINSKPGFWVRSGSDSYSLFSEGKIPFNACRVNVTKNIPFFFIFGATGENARLIEAVATARQNSARMARLNIRSKLLTLNTQQSKILNALVGKILGGNIDLEVASWQGLLGANISLLSYLDALAVKLGVNVGDYDALLNTKADAGVLLGVMADVVSKDKTLGLAADALAVIKSKIGASLGGLTIGELLNLQTPAKQSALNALVNVLDLVQVIGSVANGKSAAEINVPIDIPLLDLLNLLNANLTIKLIEPPQWKIGDPMKEKVWIKTSQIKVLLNVKVLSLLGIPVAEVDLSVAGAGGYAEVTKAICDVGGKQLNVMAKTSLLDLYLGVSLFGSKPIPTIRPPKYEYMENLSPFNPALSTKDDIFLDKYKNYWKKMSSLRVVESLTNQLVFPIDFLLKPISYLLDQILNLLFGVLGINLAVAELAGQLDCGYDSDLVY
ncbi:MAG: pilus assembly protein TadG-related protein [Comamonas sp.]|uniref:pilus assembly protein TadG-related protein n=1 Tax=Comamonas sp. TaxID=34028 RepID=UPI002FC6DFB1